MAILDALFGPSLRDRQRAIRDDFIVNEPEGAPTPGEFTQEDMRFLIGRLQEDREKDPGFLGTGLFRQTRRGPVERQLIQALFERGQKSTATDLQKRKIEEIATDRLFQRLPEIEDFNDLQALTSLRTAQGVQRRQETVEKTKDIKADTDLVNAVTQRALAESNDPELLARTNAVMNQKANLQAKYDLKATKQALNNQPLKQQSERTRLEIEASDAEHDKLMQPVLQQLEKDAVRVQELDVILKQRELETDAEHKTKAWFKEQRRLADEKAALTNEALRTRAQYFENKMTAAIGSQSAKSLKAQQEAFAAYQSVYFKKFREAKNTKGDDIQYGRMSRMNRNVWGKWMAQQAGIQPDEFDTQNRQIIRAYLDNSEGTKLSFRKVDGDPQETSIEDLREFLNAVNLSSKSGVEMIKEDFRRRLASAKTQLASAKTQDEKDRLTDEKDRLTATMQDFNMVTGFIDVAVHWPDRMTEEQIRDLSGFLLERIPVSSGAKGAGRRGDVELPASLQAAIDNPKSFVAEFPVTEMGVTFNVQVGTPPATVPSGQPLTFDTDDGVFFGPFHPGAIDPLAK